MLGGDWGEHFPVDILAPFAGGAALWFGLNYAFLAPDVIGPRLAEKYYTPACLSAVAESRAREVAAAASLKDRMAAQVQAYRVTVTKQLSGAANQVIGDAASVYGNDAAIVGGLLGGLTQRALQMDINAKVDQFENQLFSDESRKAEARRADVKHTDPAAFCGCNVRQVYADRLQLAAFTSSLRFYKPDAFEQLEQGNVVGEACGHPPVV